MQWATLVKKTIVDSVVPASTRVAKDTVYFLSVVYLENLQQLTTGWGIEYFLQLFMVLIVPPNVIVPNLLSVQSFTSFLLVKPFGICGSGSHRDQHFSRHALIILF